MEENEKTIFDLHPELRELAEKYGETDKEFDFQIPEDLGPTGFYEIPLEAQVYHSEALKGVLQGLLAAVVSKYGKCNFWITEGRSSPTTVHWERAINGN